MSTDTPGAQEFGEEESWEAAGRSRTLRRTPRGGLAGSTLVTREHRGNGLGAALKIANHAALGEHTNVERIYMWNAVENSRMLVINDRAGFATWAWMGLWKKCLA